MWYNNVMAGYTQMLKHDNLRLNYNKPKGDNSYMDHQSSPSSVLVTVIMYHMRAAETGWQLAS